MLASFVMRKNVMRNLAVTVACLALAIVAASAAPDDSTFLRRLASTTSYKVDLKIIGCHHENSDCPHDMKGPKDYGHMPYPYPHISIANSQEIKRKEDYDHYQAWMENFAHGGAQPHDKWEPHFSDLKQRMHGDGTNKDYPYEVTQSNGHEFKDKTIMDIAEHITKYGMKADGAKGIGFHITVPKPWVDQKTKLLMDSKQTFLKDLNWYLYDAHDKKMYLLNKH